MDQRSRAGRGGLQRFPRQDQRGGKGAGPWTEGNKGRRKKGQQQSSTASGRRGECNLQCTLHMTIECVASPAATHLAGRSRRKCLHASEGTASTADQGGVPMTSKMVSSSCRGRCPGRPWRVQGAEEGVGVVDARAHHVAERLCSQILS